jgi:hypothetical protein
MTFGPKKFVSVTIFVDPHLSITAGAQIASRAKWSVMSDEPSVAEITIRVKPFSEAEQPDSAGPTAFVPYDNHHLLPLAPDGVTVAGRCSLRRR